MFQRKVFSGPDDADYVQVVHTDAFARGILAASGHQDFYMNGGIEQPGCSDPGSQRNQSLYPYFVFSFIGFVKSVYKYYLIPKTVSSYHIYNR